LLDLMMPHEGGMTVIRHLRKQRPAMLKRAVLFTGSPDSLVDAVSGEVEAVVQKPFKAQDLIDVVRRVSA
jgi:CheY-like chemotaxis protein